MKFTFISSAGVCGRRQILAAFVICASACWSSVLLAGPVKEAETKVLSTSPDGQVEIVTTVPKRDAEYHKEWMELWGSNLQPGVTVICSGLYVRHKRNEGEEWQALEEYKDTGHYKLKIQWYGTSHVFSLFAWDEKDGFERWFVLRQDGKASRWVYLQPTFPDVREAIYHAGELPKALVHVEKGLDGPEGRPLNPMLSWRTELVEAKVPSAPEQPIELRFSYFMTSVQGGRLEKAHQYQCVFQTMDWTKYELKKVTRFGSLEDDPEGFDYEKKVVLFPKKKE